MKKTSRFLVFVIVLFAAIPYYKDEPLTKNVNMFKKSISLNDFNVILKPDRKTLNHNVSGFRSSPDDRKL
ncbi:MAG: hypothetical protein R2819_00160 [Allomuricauda sp.]